MLLLQKPEDIFGLDKVRFAAAMTWPSYRKTASHHQSSHSTALSTISFHSASPSTFVNVNHICRVDVDEGWTTSEEAYDKAGLGQVAQLLLLGFAHRVL